MNDLPTAQQTSKRQRRQIVILCCAAVGMFGVAFAMVPLYQWVCSVTGLNSISSEGSRISERDLLKQGVNSDRLVTVQFDATLNEQLPFTISPAHKELKVHPGEAIVTSYQAINNAGRVIVSQAVPGITPWQASEFFHKIECFCFSQQTLQAGEVKDMALRFVVDPDLPEDISVLTLSYTFMDVNRETNKEKQHEHRHDMTSHRGMTHDNQATVATVTNKQ